MLKLNESSNPFGSNLNEIILIFKVIKSIVFNVLAFVSLVLGKGALRSGILIWMELDKVILIFKIEESLIIYILTLIALLFGKWVLWSWIFHFWELNISPVIVKMGWEICIRMSILRDRSSLFRCWILIVWRVNIKLQ